MPCEGECIENMVRVCPKVAAEPDGAIGDEEGPKGEGIAHEEIPHHKLSIAHVKWTSTTTPHFSARLYCCSCHLEFFNIDAKIKVNSSYKNLFYLYNTN